MSFALGWKCYVRNWTVTKFCDIDKGDFRFRFRFFGRKWNFIFVGIFVGPKMKNAFRSASTSNCFRLHLTSMIFKHSTIPVPDSRIRCLKKLVLPSILTKVILHRHRRRRRRRRVVRVNRCTSMTPGDLRSPQRRSVERWHPSELVEPDVARATRRSSPAGHCLSAFVGTHHQAQSMMCWYSRVQACKMAKQIEISVNDVKCHQWLINQIAEAPLHWRHESTSVSSICRWHLMWKASSVFMSATKRVYVSVP